MKFLCVPCDRPMQLRAVAPPDRGSLSVVYSCPDCGYEIAMLTNPYETQLVQSLGVRVGPPPAPAAGAKTVDAPDAAGGLAFGVRSSEQESGADAVVQKSNCPFAAMVSSSPSPAAEPQRDADTHVAPDRRPLPWTAAAEARLANIPAFVRPMARTGIETFAREKGCGEVDETILDAARDYFGM